MQPGICGQWSARLESLPDGAAEHHFLRTSVNNATKENYEGSDPTLADILSRDSSKTMKEIKLLNILFTKDFFTTSNEQCSE